MNGSSEFPGGFHNLREQFAGNFQDIPIRTDSTIKNDSLNFTFSGTLNTRVREDKLTPGIRNGMQEHFLYLLLKKLGIAIF